MRNASPQLIRALVAVTVLAAASAHVHAAEKHPPEITQIVAEGEAPANAANARELAIADALRNAVTQVVGVYVSATTIGDNYKLVRNEVIARSSGFAALDKVESESVTNGILKVRAMVTVSDRPLAEKLRELGLTHDWKIGIVSRMKGSHDRVAMESAMAQQLVDAGFRVIDESRRAQLSAAESAVRAAAGDKACLAAIAREFDVDILIASDALVENVDSAVEGGVTFYRSRSNVQATAYYADTGEVLAMTNATAEALDQSQSLSARQCLRKAGVRLGEELAQDLLVAPAALDPFVVVRITGVKKMTVASEIEKTIRHLSGVTRVTRQRLANGTLELNVHVDSALRDHLPDRLESSVLGRRTGLRTDLWTRTFLQAHLE